MFNIGLMFLFPWLDWGNDISDFEKIDFWGVMSDFWLCQPTAGAIFDSGDLQSIGLRVAQKKNFEKFFFGNFQKTSKLSKVVGSPWRGLTDCSANRRTSAENPSFLFLGDLMFGTPGLVSPSTRFLPSFLV